MVDVSGIKPINVDQALRNLRIYDNEGVEPKKHNPAEIAAAHAAADAGRADRGVVDQIAREAAMHYMLVVVARSRGFLLNKRSGRCPVTGDAVLFERGFTRKTSGGWRVYSPRAVLRSILDGVTLPIDPQG